jgi:hypothetical protein
MISKIISEGRHGVERAALDVAIKLDIPHSGWVPKGRKPGGGVLSEKYNLKEISASSHPKTIEKNILDSDGTLIISQETLLGDSVLIGETAEKHSRPWLHVDLNTTNDFIAAQTISVWISENGIETLNISGPETGKDPKIYKATAKLLETVLYLDLMGFSLRTAERALKRVPKTIEDAADVLISRLSLRDKTIIANMNRDDLYSIHLSLGEFIKSNFGLWEGNEELIASCRSVLEKNSLEEDDAASVIIGEVWERLRKTHRIRAVK